MSKECDKATGQCRCKTGVIGMRCDRCAHSFAELTAANGCQPVYESCPAEYRGSLWWERTAYGRGRTSDCPDGAVGSVTRNCTAAGWEEPDFSRCVHRDLYLLDSSSSSSSSSSPDSESWSVALKLSDRLNSMLDGSSFSFAGDVSAVSRVLRGVLRRESGLRGFGLAHRKDRNFLRHLLSSFSWVLGKHGRGKSATAKSRSDAADANLLLRQFVAYGAHLADTMEDTFTNPFEVVTDNVIFGLDRYQKKGGGQKDAMMGGAVFIPKYDNFMASDDAWNTAKIKLDVTSTDGSRKRRRRREVQRLRSGDDDDFGTGVVQYMFVRTRPNETLPRSSMVIQELRWETTVRLVSDVVAYTTDRDRRIRNAPISLEEELLLEEDGGEPESEAVVVFEGKKEKEQNRLYCVSWDLELGVWTTDKCEKVGEEERRGLASTVVTCSCRDSPSHTFALVEERMERGREYLSTSEQKLAFSLACLLDVVLLAACLLYLLLCNRGARNTVSIHANITFSLLCFEVLLVLTVCFNHAMSLATGSGGSSGSGAFACHAVVMLSHFFGLSCFAWSLISAFHLYRMMKELRDINSGSMSFYTAAGYGAPALVVLLTLGAAGKNYSGADVCWVSHDGSSVLVWSVLAPVAALLLLSFACILLNVRMIFLTSSSSSSGVSDVDDIFKLRATFFLNLGVHPLLAGTFLSALVLLYSEQGYLMEACYAFVGLAFATGCYFLVAFVLLDCRLFRRGRGAKEAKKTGAAGGQQTRAARSALSYQQKPPHHQHTSMAMSGLGGVGVSGHTSTLEKKHLSPSVASTTSASTTFRQASTVSHKHSFMDSDSEEDDGDSDLDRRSFDLASSHSSDDGDDDVDASVSGGGGRRRGPPLPPYQMSGGGGGGGGRDNLFVRDYPMQ